MKNETAEKKGYDKRLRNRFRCGTIKDTDDRRPLLCTADSAIWRDGKSDKKTPCRQEPAGLLSVSEHHANTEQIYLRRYCFPYRRW